MPANKTTSGVSTTQHADTPRLTCLPPVVDRHARALILGSLPGNASLAAQAYYAHPRNHFWRIMSTLLNEDGLIDRPYEQRLAVLRHHHIGLWDVVAQAHRQGSLDQHLKNIAANPLAKLITTLPQLKAIAFNGQTAARIGQRQLQHIAAERCIALLPMPSTSPAHTMPLAEKIAAWQQLLQQQ